MSLQIGGALGKGAWAVTYLGTYDGKVAAIKMIDLEKFRRRRGLPLIMTGENPLNDDMLAREIKALKDLSAFGCSDYVVCFYDAIEYKSDERRYMAIVTEYIQGEELTNLIKKEGPLQPKLLWALMQQLLLGLEFIHEAGFAHRDIKPENVIVTQDKTPKYIDFGYACEEICIESSGTRIYNPPEAFNGEKEISLVRAQAHDMWSLAVMFYEMSHGFDNLPFHSSYDEHIENENIKQAPQIPPHYDLDEGQTNKFLNYLLVNDWTQRPTITKAIDKFLEIIGDQGYPIVLETH